MSQFHGQKLVCTREVTNAVSGLGGPGTHFLALEAQLGETGFLVTFLRPVSGSVSRHVKNPQSGKIREVSGKVSGKSNNKRKGAGAGIKNGRHIYVPACPFRDDKLEMIVT